MRQIEEQRKGQHRATRDFTGRSTKTGRKAPLTANRRIQDSLQVRAGGKETPAPATRRDTASSGSFNGFSSATNSGKSIRWYGAAEYQNLASWRPWLPHSRHSTAGH